MNLGTPPLPLALRLGRSAASTWFVVRLMGAFVGVVGRPPLGAGIFVVLVLVLVWWNVRRMNERLLFANLAVRPLTVSATAVLVATVLELVLWTVIGFSTSVLALTPHPPMATGP